MSVSLVPKSTTFHLNRIISYHFIFQFTTLKRLRVCTDYVCAKQ